MRIDSGMKRKQYKPRIKGVRAVKASAPKVKLPKVKAITSMLKRKY